MLDDCTVRPNLVMATGGGAVLAEENRLALQSRGIVIYLRASVEELYRRTSRDRNRPLLAHARPQSHPAWLARDARGRCTTRVADIVVETGTTAVHQLVAHIVERLRQVDKAIDQSAKSRPG